MLKRGRRTTVVWSFESNSLGEPLKKTIAGQEVDAIRLVAEEGKMAETLDFLASIKKGGELSDRTPVLVDLYSQARAKLFLQGENDVDCKFGDILDFSTQEGQGNFYLKCRDWGNFLASDSLLYLGNGDVVLKPLELGADFGKFEVIQGGRIYHGVEAHAPSTKKPPRIEEIPDDSWLATRSKDVDCVILPSFERVEDLEKAVQQIANQEHQPWIFLKIGTAASCGNLEKLLPLVHGVLVSRVELSMSMDPVQVPMLTKEIVAQCNRLAKISLVASEMLGSMRFNATPTRAEVSDIGNAVFDGADGVVLSEDLSYGEHAARGLELAKKTIMEVENSHDERLNWQKYMPRVKEEIEAVTYAAYRAAFRNNAKAIVCITKKGNTALHLASFDITTPIIAVTLSKDVVRRLELIRGVEGFYIEELPPIDEVLPLINQMLLRDSWLNEGDKYVFVSVTISSLGREDSNLFTIQTLD